MKALKSAVAFDDHRDGRESPEETVPCTDATDETPITGMTESTAKVLSW